VVLVEVKSSAASTRLTGPRLAPARLDAVRGERLHLKTTYATGGAAYEAETRELASHTCTLVPADLGLAMVTIDATERRRRGASSLQLRLKYTPAGAAGTADETILRFRYGDWTSVWFVISRSDGLNGVLEYSLKEVAADGTITDHPPVKTDNLHLKL
jgi:hypothetical protein